MWKLAPIVLLIAGCKLYGAANSGTETLTITSEPQGITVKVDGQILTTPAIIEIAQRRSHTVHYSEAEGATYRKTPAQEARRKTSTPWTQLGRALRRKTSTPWTQLGRALRPVVSPDQALTGVGA